MNLRKNNAKVLLVQPNYARQRNYTKYSVSPPLGLAHIAGGLQKNGIYVEILDANALDLSTDQVVQYAIDTKATIVGVSTLMTGYKFGIEIAQKLPKNILSVAGGVYASSAPKRILRDGFDIAVKGPGKSAMVDLALGKDLSEIKGICYWKNKKIVYNPKEAIKDLGEDFFLARNLLLNNGVNKPYRLEGTMDFPWAPIFTSIGCPYRCYWCSKQVFDRYIPRTPDDVVEEICELVKKYKVKEIDIYDDCFNADMKRAEKILDMIIERNLNIKLRFPNGIRADRVNRHFMEKMRKAGCIEIAYGIESGDQDVLDKIPKQILLEDIRKAVKYTKRVGILTVGFFILGLRGDNKRSMQRTIDFAKSLNLDVAFFSILTPYPGTPLWEMIEKEGKFFINDFDDLHQSSGKMLFSHPEFPLPELVEGMYKKAYREFYFSPKYLFNRLLACRHWDQLTLNIRGLSNMLRTQFRRES